MASEITNGESLDKALHASMNLIWKTYREDPDGLYDLVRELYKKYPDATVCDFVVHMVFGLLNAVRRKEGGV